MLSSTCWIRGVFDGASPPGRSASSSSSGGASRTCLPGGEALAHAAVGDVAVAVVGVLGEDRPHQLGDRVAVRLVHRAPVHLAQPVADRQHPPARGPLPGGVPLRDPAQLARPGRCAGRARPAPAPARSGSAIACLLGQRHAARILSAARGRRRPRSHRDRQRRRRRRRRSSSGGCPGEGPPAVLVHGVPTHSEEWLPFLERHARARRSPSTCPGFGRSERPAPERFDYSMHGLRRASSSASSSALGIDEHSLVRPRLGRGRPDRGPARAEPRAAAAA